MNKKLLTVAVTAGLAATSMSAIAADATIYGRISQEWVNVEGNTGKDDTEVNEPGNSYWGLSVKEKLSGGLTALAKIEWAVGGADTGHGDRQQWVGMSGNFGTIALGSFNGIYKSTNPDPLNASFLEARGNGGVSGGNMGHQSYINNAVMWESPTVSGITASVMMMDEQASGVGNQWQASVKYENGPMKFWLAHSESPGDSAVTTGDDASLTKIGGSMSMAGMTFYLQYEDDDGGLNDPSANGSVQTGSTTVATDAAQDGEVLLVGATYKMGNTTLVGQYGNSDYDGTANETDYFALAAIHNFSKTTKIYGGWRQTDNDTAGQTEIDLFGVGLQVNF